MNHSMQPVDFLAPIGSIAAYEAHVAQISMLSAAEEEALARRWFEEKDLEAAKKLVLAHLRFVVKIARGYLGYGLPQADLIQEGNIGLMKAVKHFDPNVGVRLATFCAYWIKSEIHEYVMRNWRLVRIATTKAQRKLFFNLRRLKKGFHWLTGNEAQIIADELKVTRQDVHEMEMRLQAQDVFLDLMPEDDSEAAYVLPNTDTGIIYQDPAQLMITHDEEQMRSQRVQQALAQLPSRTREIILARHLTEEKTNLQTLAAQFGISAERVRQIEQAGMLQLQKALLDVPLISSGQ
jgi:RNA polymerase sigma-32 factor